MCAWYGPAGLAPAATRRRRQLHEFEALLLSSPRTLEEYFVGCGDAIDEIDRMAAGFESPEHIDDGDETAPSRRIELFLPKYASVKTLAGPQVAAAIGLQVVRERCRHFGTWLDRLERLGD
jgi:hypothetical protein